MLVTATVGFLTACWWQLRGVWAAALVGTGAQLLGYAVAMLGSPDPYGTQDVAAGAGAALMGVPTALTISALLWSGAGLALATRALQRRRRTPER